MRAVITALLLTFSSHFAIAEESPLEEELILSTPEQLGALSNSDFLIKGLVSPLSGNLSLRQTDLVAKGAQNITLERLYFPPHIPSALHKKKHKKENWDKYFLYEYLNKNYKGWQFYPHLRLQRFANNTFRVTDSNGATLDYNVSGSHTTLAGKPYGISNAAGDMPSGKYDPRNTKIRIQEKDNNILLKSSDGIQRIYRFRGSFDASSKSYIYHLEKEILPNGKILKYQYNRANILTSVESLSPDEKYIYANIHVEGYPESGSCTFVSSSGDRVNYRYE